MIFDISSKMSGMALTTTPSVMAPCTSKASFSTSNQMEVPIPTMMPFKRPLNGYMRFAMEMRPMVTRQNPNMKVTEVSKVLGQKYKELPDQRKMSLSQTFKTELEKYQKEFEAFKNTPEGKEIVEKIIKEQSLGKSFKSNADVNANFKAIGEKWKGMSEKQKAPYIEKFKELSAKYEKDLTLWKANLGEEEVAKINAIEKKITTTRNAIKGIVPKPKRKKKKVVAKKVKKAKKPAKAKKTTKEPVKAPTKAKKAKQ